jgi:hypothetical protein
MYQYKCYYCPHHISDKTHEWCQRKGYVDHCWDHTDRARKDFNEKAAKTIEQHAL